jgi:hypothetical protein
VLIDAGTGETRDVVASSDEADVSDVLFHPLTHEPLAYAVERERFEWVVLDRETGERLAALDEALSGDFEIASQTRDNGEWLVEEQIQIRLYTVERRAYWPLPSVVNRRGTTVPRRKPGSWNRVHSASTSGFQITDRSEFWS